MDFGGEFVGYFGGRDVSFVGDFGSSFVGFGGVGGSFVGNSGVGGVSFVGNFGFKCCKRDEEWKTRGMSNVEWTHEKSPLVPSGTYRVLCYFTS